MSDHFDLCKLLSPKILKQLSVVMLISGILLLPACYEQTSDKQKTSVSSLAIVDLDKVAQATGKDKLIADQVQQFTQSGEERLKKLREDLVAEVEKNKAELGDKPKQEDQVALVKLARESDAKLKQEITKVQGDAGRLKVKLVMDFKNEVQPIVRQIAHSMGISVVAVKSPEYIYMDPAVDITDKVIDKMLAMQGSSPADKSASKK